MLSHMNLRPMERLLLQKIWEDEMKSDDEEEEDEENDDKDKN